MPLPADTLERHQRIEKALLGLDPASFQSLAVGFVRLRDGDGIPWQALNSEGQTIKGQPDGRVTTAAQKIIDVEVSTDRDWNRKVEQDIEALARRGPDHLRDTNQLIFVTSHRINLSSKSDTTADEERELRRAAAARLPLRGDQIRFVHLNELTTELTHPRYAQLVGAQLGVTLQPSPFQTVGNVIDRRFRIMREEWLPQPESFNDGTLRVPAAVDAQIAQALASESQVLVSGQGASGKTTLALLIGRRVERSGRVALYLDLELKASVEPYVLADCLAKSAPSGTLVIFDNVHVLSPNALTEFYSVMRKSQEEGLIGASLLYLARRTSRGTGDAVELPIAEVSLASDPSLLECVFDYYASQAVKRGFTVPPSARAAWCENPHLFGYDLVVFSIAAHSHLDRLGKPPTSWAAVDDWVRRKYIAPYANVQPLMALAAAGQFGVRLTAKSLGPEGVAAFMTPGAGTASLIDRGVVLYLDDDDRYGLVHTSFAALLLRGKRMTEAQVAELLRQVIGSDGTVGVALIIAMHREERTGRAGANVALIAEMRRVLASDDEKIAALLLGTSAPTWRPLLAALAGGGVYGGDRAWRTAVGIAMSPAMRAQREQWIEKSGLVTLAALGWLPHEQRAQLAEETVRTVVDLEQAVLNLTSAAMSRVLKSLDDDRDARIVAARARLEGVIAVPAVAENFASRSMTAEVSALLDYLQRRTEQHASAEAGKAWHALTEQFARRSADTLLAQQGPLGIVLLLRHFAQFDDLSSRRLIASLRQKLEQLTLTHVESFTNSLLVGFLEAVEEFAPRATRRILKWLTNDAILKERVERIGTLTELRMLLRYVDRHAGEHPQLPRKIRKLLADDRSDVAERLGATALPSLHDLAAYIEDQRYPEDGEIIRRIRFALTGADFMQVVAGSLMQRARALHLLAGEPGDLANRLIVNRLLAALSEPQLLRRVVDASSRDLAYTTRFLWKVEQQGTGGAAIVELTARMRNVLRSTDVQNDLRSRMGVAVERGFNVHDSTASLHRTLRRFDPEIDAATFGRWTSENSQVLIDEIQTADTITRKAALLSLLHLYEPERAFPLIDGLFADAESLTATAPATNLGAIVQLILLGRSRDQEQTRRFLVALPVNLDLSDLYLASAGTLVHFLQAAYSVLGPGREFNALYHVRLSRVATKLFWTWPHQPGESDKALTYTIGLIGMLSCFGGRPRFIPPANRVIASPKEIDGIMSMSDGRQIPVYLGLMHLGLRAGGVAAERVREHIAQRQASVEDPIEAQLLARIAKWATV